MMVRIIVVIAEDPTIATKRETVRRAERRFIVRQRIAVDQRDVQQREQQPVVVIVTSPKVQRADAGQQLLYSFIQAVLSRRIHVCGIMDKFLLVFIL